MADTVSPDVEAVRELVEIAVRLRETGLLDMLRVVAEKGEEILSLIANDKALARAAGLLYAAQAGIENLEAEEVLQARATIEEAVECTLRAAARAAEAEVKPVGLLGLLTALRDKRVQAGLALLLEAARAAGDCIMEKRGRNKSSSSTTG